MVKDRSKKIGTKTISFTEKDKDLFDWINDQDNASRFVLRILRKEYNDQSLPNKNDKQ